MPPQVLTSGPKLCGGNKELPYFENLDNILHDLAEDKGWRMVTSETRQDAETLV